MALPVSIRLISHNIRYATAWPTTGEGEDIVFVNRFNDRLTTPSNSIMGGLETPNCCLYVTRHVPEALFGLQRVLHSQLLDLLDGLNVHSEPID